MTAINQNTAKNPLEERVARIIKIRERINEYFKSIDTVRKEEEQVAKQLFQILPYGASHPSFSSISTKLSRINTNLVAMMDQLATLVREKHWFEFVQPVVQSAPTNPGFPNMSGNGDMFQRQNIAEHYSTSSKVDVPPMAQGFAHGQQVQQPQMATQQPQVQQQAPQQAQQIDFNSFNSVMQMLAHMNPNAQKQQPVDPSAQVPPVNGATPPVTAPLSPSENNVSPSV